MDFYVLNEELNLMSFILNINYYSFGNKHKTLKQLKELKFDDLDNLDFFIKTPTKIIPTFLWTSYVISILSSFKTQKINMEIELKSFLASLKTILKTNVDDIDEIIKIAQENFKNKIALLDYLKKITKAWSLFDLEIKKAILNKDLAKYVQLALNYNQIQNLNIIEKNKQEDKQENKKEDDLNHFKTLFNDFYNTFDLQKITQITNNKSFLSYLYNLEQKLKNKKIINNATFLYLKNYWNAAYYKQQSSFFEAKLGGIQKNKKDANIYSFVYAKNPSYLNDEDCFLLESSLINYQTGNVHNFWDNYLKQENKLDIFLNDDDIEQKCTLIYINYFKNIINKINKIDDSCIGYFANGLYLADEFIPINLNNDLLKLHNTYMQYFQAVLIYKLNNL